MSDIKLYIGSDLCDFNEPINVVMSIGDLRDISLGNLNKSYSLNVPLTKTNRAIIKNSHLPGSTDEISDIGRLYVNGMLIISGKVQQLLSQGYYIKLIITADDWMDDLLNTNLLDIDFTAEDHLLNKTNIVASWSAAEAFYRYPFVNFGQLVIPPSGAQPHEWSVNDFIPMFRIVDILEYIFSPIIIVSDWITSAAAKKFYVLCSEKKADSSFTANKALDVRVNAVTDNQYSKSITAGATDVLTLTKDPVSFQNEVTDEGADWSTILNKYVVPETGTYKFILHTAIYSSMVDPGFSSISHVYTIQVLYNNGGGDITLAEATGADSGEIPISVDIETSYYHLEAAGEIRVKAVLSTTGKNEGATNTYYIQLTTATKLVNVWTEWNLYPGEGKNITAVDYLPDIKAIDFLKAVKHVANLKFFYDRNNHNIYIEPSSSFYSTSEEIDLTTIQDFTEDPLIEPISVNYCKNIIMGFIEDESDNAYKEYKDAYGITDRKTIALTSVYAKDGDTELLNSLFAHTAVGGFYLISAYLDIPKIYGSQNQNMIGIHYHYPEYRPTGYKPRLLSWEGLTAGISFNITGTTYTNFPKALPVDFSDLYDSYWITTIHQVDKNRIVTLKIKLPMTVLNQLLAVTNDSTKEGFRPKYKLLIRDQYVYGYINRVTTDGNISEVEFVLKN